MRTRDGALYTGIALDVSRRLAQHAGTVRGGAKALRGRGPLRLELARAVGSRSLAQAIEWRIKRLPRARKQELLARRRAFDRLLFPAGSGTNVRLAATKHPLYHRDVRDRGRPMKKS